MGFFSWDCESCGHPMLSPSATEDKNGWMSNCVALGENGSVLVGEYDGYGRLDGMEIDYIKPCVYHADCWVHKNKPGYTGESNGSADQGFFFDDNVHNIESPLKKKPLDAVAEAARRAKEEIDECLKEDNGYSFFDKVGRKSNSLFSYEPVKPIRPGGGWGHAHTGVFENVEILQPLQCTDSFVIPPETRYSKAVIRPYYDEASAGFLVEIIFHGVCLSFTHTVILKTDLFGESSWVNGWID